MNLSEVMQRVQKDLGEVEQALLKRIAEDKSRGRAGPIRALHEVRQMKNPRYLYCSQAGQDMIVDQLLNAKTGGTFADIGGYDGVSGSNTLFFEQFRGWTGVLVEPVQAQRQKAEALRRCPCLPYAVDTQDGTAEFVEVLEGFTQMSGLSESYDPGILEQVRADPRHREVRVTVQTRTLSGILTEAGLEDVDFLSLDIEGGEVRVLEDFPFDKHNIAIWSIENNTGSGEIGEIMRANGYLLAEFCGPDEIWRHSAL